MVCTGSPKLCEAAPPPPESIYAKEGQEGHKIAEGIIHGELIRKGEKLTDLTAFLEEAPELEDETAHHIAASYLASGRSPIDIQKEFNVEDDMADAIAEYVDYVIEQTMAEGTLHANEQLVYIPQVHEDCWGTMDTGIYHPSTNTAEIVDFKGGAGIAVPAETPQTALYAVGFINGLRENGVPMPDKVKCTIIQPRATHLLPSPRSVEYTIVELVEFVASVRKVVPDVLTGGKLVPGEHCRFCPAKLICPAIDMAVKEPAMFEVYQGDVKALADPRALQPERLLEILEMTKMLDPLAREAERVAHDYLAAGGHLAGWKLVNKRATRVHNDEQKSVEFCKQYNIDPYNEPKLKSPSQIERAIKVPRGQKAGIVAEFNEKHVSKISTGTTLTRESDPKPGINTPKILRRAAESIELQRMLGLTPTASAAEK